MNLTFVTTNEGKLKEAKEILKQEIESSSLKLDEVQTLDPIECVEKKAEAAYKILQKPVLVEDTSLFFDAWNGLPGVFIDYFMKTLNNEGLTKLLKVEPNRKAKAQTSLCFYDGKEKVTVVGEIKGEIADSPRGKDGFGWDSIFIPEGKDKTFAEMNSEEKNKISMRKLAFEKLSEKLHI